MTCEENRVATSTGASGLMALAMGTALHLKPAGKVMYCEQCGSCCMQIPGDPCGIFFACHCLFI